MSTPTFTEYWNLTNKTGLKEKLAKRWRYLPPNLRISIINKVKDLKTKPAAETYLNIGR